ncbi:histone deacetylase family protein [Neptuniibacter sp. CAU 1671]|uniref:histone deacetylase family protein n=1 Tax=Neptuniibacter sp. CAU 1671 TaxID=3032593 RepID=UPI0023DA906F|nr:histone deacetylase family protein [Neptuniibacter sp. CAU 1671]MDF2182988.1 histone deacetylase family protein [Neptuniibacter sp. CAU 1671]
MKTLYLSHLDCQRHEMGDYHPECPQRLQYIDRAVHSALSDQLVLARPEPVADSDLLRVHPKAFLEMLAQLSPGHGHAFVDADVSMNRYSLQAARLAAGAAVQATQQILAGRVDNAFCAVRPPGHHAERDSAMGFCIFNNVAVAVETALLDPTVERVAVLDFDVHHGNGTVEIFQDRPEVLVCSSFQHPFYPGRFVNIDRPNIINTPLPAGTAGDQFRLALERDWLPALKQHQPQMIFVSAGFDAHKDDPLGGLLLDESDFRWVSQLIMDAAERYSGGRWLATLEGGYNLEALSRSVVAQLEVMAGVKV